MKRALEELEPSELEHIAVLERETVVEFLSKQTPKTIGELLVVCCYKNYNQLFDVVLDTFGVSEDYLLFCMHTACKSGSAEIVRKLGEMVAPDFKAMKLAIFHKKTEVVRVLLANPDVELEANTAGFACTYGNAEIVRLFLQDERTNPIFCLQAAVRFDRGDIVTVLLQDPRIDPSDDEYEAVYYAVMNTQRRSICAFIADGRVMVEMLLEFAEDAEDDYIASKMIMDCVKNRSERVG
jgi:hypothetical protein